MSDKFIDLLAADPASQMTQEQASDIYFGLSAKEAEVQEANKRKLEQLARAQQSADYALSAKGQIATLGTDNPHIASLTAGMVAGVGSIADGVAGLADSETGEAVGNWFKEGADNIRDSRGQEYANDVTRATPTGDLFSPSTWDLGDGNLTGLIGLGNDVVGQLAPQLVGGTLGAVVKGSKAVLGLNATQRAMVGGGVVGGLQGGGAAARDQWDFIDGLNHDQLMENSTLYADLVATGKSPEEARKTVRAEAARAATIVAGTVAGAGGAATQYILRGLPDIIGKATAKAFADTPMPKRLADLGNAGVLATISAVEEGSQEAAEAILGRAAANEAIGSDRQIDKDAFTDLILGSMAGAGISVAVTVPKMAIDTLKEGFDAFNNITVDESADAEVSETLSQEGDISEEQKAKYATPGSPDYNPIVIVRAAYKNLKEGDEQAQVTALEQTQAMKSRNDNWLKQLQMTLYYSSEAGMEAGRKLVADLDEAIANGNLDENTKANQMGIRNLVQSMMDNPPTVEERKQLEKTKAKVAKYSEQLQKYTDSISTKFTGGIDPDASINPETEPAPQADTDTGTSESSADTEANAGSGTQASAQATQASKQATKADATVIRAMDRPESYSVEQLRAILATEGTGLTDRQKDYLRSSVEARDAMIAAGFRPGMGNTQAGVFKGTEGFKGLVEYRANTAAASIANDPATIATEIGGITRFMASHASKYATVQAALAQAQQTGVPVQVVRTKSQLWQISEETLTETALRENAGLTIDPVRSAALIPNIKKELDAIRAVRNEMLMIQEGGLHNDARTAYRNSQKTVQEETEATNGDATVNNADPAADSQVNTAEPTPEAEQEPSVNPQQSEQRPEDASTEVTEEVDTAPATEETADTTAEEIVPETDQNQDQEQEQNQEQEQDQAVEEETVTDETTTETDEEVATDETVEEEVTPEPGAIEGLGTVNSVDGTEATTDLLRKYIKQSAGKKDDPRMLVAEKNYLTTLLSKGELGLLTRLPEGATDAELAGTFGFLQEVQKLNEAVQGLVVKGVTGFEHQNFMSYFVQEDGTIPENVATAISIAALEWLGSSAKDSLMNTDDDIRRILSMDRDEPVTPAQRKALQKVGMRRELQARSLGSQITRMLGLSPANADVPANYMSNLQAALGGYALAALADTNKVYFTHVLAMDSLKNGGYASRSIEAREALLAQDGRDATGERMNMTSAKFVRAQVSELNSSVLPGSTQELMDLERDARKVLPKMFGNEPTVTPPDLEMPTEFTQSSISNSFQGVPEPLRQAAEAAYKRPWRIRMNGVAGVFMKMSSATQLALSGVQQVPDVIHVAQRDTIESKNIGLERERDNFLDFMRIYGIDETNRIYLKPDVWNQQRVGLDSQMLNPQSSKVHRHLMAMEAWETDVSTDKRSKSYKFFGMAVAQGLSIDTDKQTIRKSLKQLNEKLQQPEIAAAIEALVEMEKGAEVTPEMEQAIAAGVAAGKANMHSLDALVAMAKYTVAKESNQKTFKSDMMYEVDGVTNGPMLAHFFLGVNNPSMSLKELGKKGGFFRRAHGFRDVGAMKENGEDLDIYETLALSLHRSLSSSDIEVSPALLAIKQLVGNMFDEETARVAKEGRSAVKTPVTATSFGSSIQMVLQSMAYEAIEKFQKEATRIVREQGTQQELNELLSLMNTVIEHSNAARKANTPKLKASLKSVLFLELTPEQEEAFITGYVNTYGQAVTRAMEDTFGGFLANRSLMNATANTTFELFKGIYEHARKVHIAKLEEQGLLKKRINAKGKPVTIGLMSAKQERDFDNRIRKAIPVVHTYFSQLEGKIQNGIGMYKRVLAATSEESEARTQTLKFAHEVNRSKSMTIVDMIRVMEAPGVGTLIKQVHSSDSAISAGVYGEFPTLNVHDANGIQLDKISETGAHMNKKTLEVLVEYSIPLQTMDTLLNTILGMKSVLEINPEYAAGFDIKAVFNDAFKSLRQQMNDEELSIPQSLMASSLVSAYTKALQMERNKLQALLEVKHIAQYSVESGHYTLTKADREMIKEKLAGLTLNLNKLREASAFIMENADTGQVPTATDTRFLEASQKAMATQVREKFKADRSNKALREVLRILTTSVTKEDALLDIESTGLLPTLATAMEDFNGYFRKTDKPVISLRVKNKAQLGIVINSLMKANTLDTAEWQKEITALAKLFKRGKKFNSEQAVKDLFTTTFPATENHPEWSVLNEGGYEDFVAFLDRAYNNVLKTPWGPVGQPLHQSNTALADFLGSGERTVGDTIAYLNKSLAAPLLADKPMPRYYRRLLQAISRKINNDMPIHYIRPGSGPLKGNYDYPVTAAAMYVGGKNPTIAVRSPDFVHSNVTTEALVHEMLHGIYTQTIIDELAKREANPKYRSAALDAIQNLESVMDVVRQNMNNNPAMVAEFAAAMESVDEFVTWGMTNAKFQQYLATIQFKSAKKSGGLLTALRSFIESLAAMLGLNTNDTALGAVLMEGATLISQSETAQQRHADRVVRSMDTSQSDQMRQWSAIQVFDSLVSDGDAVKSARLRDVMRTVVNKVHGAAGALKSAANDMAAYNPRDLYLSAEVSGRMPFYSEMRSYIGFTEQEAYVLEQVELSVKAALDPSTLAYRELRIAYNDARKMIKPEDLVADWANASTAEKAAANDIHRTLFSLQGSASDYLSRFAAMMTVYEPLRVALDRVAPATPMQAESFVQRVERIINRIMDFLSSRLLHIDKQNATVKQNLDMLIKQLAQMDANRKMVLSQRKNGRLEQRLTAMTEYMDSARDKVTEWADRLSASNNRTAAVAGTLIGTVSGDRLSQIVKGFQQLRNARLQSDERLGVVASAVSEIRGPDEADVLAYDLAREANKNEKAIVQEIENTRRMILDGFADNGTNLTKEDTYALTSIVLETDLGVAVPKYGLDGIRDMLLDPARIDAEIDALRNTVVAMSGKYGNYLVRGAADLGFYMATNVNHNPNLALNTDVLLSLQGTSEAGKLTKAMQREIRNDLDLLVTLEALRSTKDSQRVRVANLIQSEGQRTDGNGVDSLVKLHALFKENALERNFGNASMLMQKGFTKEIFNQHNDVVVANDVEGADLQKLGYVKIADPIHPDKADPNQTIKHVYIAEGFGLRRRETGIVAFTNTRSKGTQLDYSDTGTVTANKDADVKALFNTPLNYRPTRTSGGQLVPLRNANGAITAWRYTMSKDGKDRYMQRHNAVEDVLSGMFGNAMSKEKTKETNRKSVQLLKDIYMNDKARRPTDYIRFAGDNPDAEIAETFRLLPDDMREAVTSIWGKDGMYVPVELYDLFFGYRRKSLVAGLFDNPENTKALKAKIARTLQSLFGSDIAMRLTRAENMWMEAITVLKDIVVIKNLFTLVGNIISNFSTLLMHGVPLKDMAKNHQVAVQGLMAYQRDSGALLRLTKLRDAGIAIQGMDLEHEIAVLKDAIEKNPIKDMVEAGLVQTIVEDVEVEDDRFSYKTQFTNWIEDKTQKIPERVREIGKHVVMTHDTPLYQLLYRGTGTSDFAARYVLYKHLTSRTVKPMSKVDALRRVDSEFVNYDNPTHSSIDLMNRLGFAMFTKYYMRIQKVLFTLYREKPLQSLMVSVLGNLLDGMQTLSDSAFWNRFGNITSGGILELPGAMDEPITLNLLTQLVK